MLPQYTGAEWFEAELQESKVKGNQSLLVAMIATRLSAVSKNSAQDSINKFNGGVVFHQILSSLHMAGHLH